MAEETEDVEEHIEVFNDIELQRKSFAEQITDEFAPYETKINAWIGEASRIKVHSIEDEEAMAKAKELYKYVSSTLRKVEERRTYLKRESLDVGRAIDDAANKFKKLLEPLKISLKAKAEYKKLLLAAQAEEKRLYRVNAMAAYGGSVDAETMQLSDDEFEQLVVDTKSSKEKQEAELEAQLAERRQVDNLYKERLQKISAQKLLDFVDPSQLSTIGIISAAQFSAIIATAVAKQSERIKTDIAAKNNKDLNDMRAELLKDLVIPKDIELELLYRYSAAEFKELMQYIKNNQPKFYSAPIVGSPFGAAPVDDGVSRIQINGAGSAPVSIDLGPGSTQAMLEKVLLSEFAESLFGIQIPEMHTEKGRAIFAAVEEMIRRMNKYILTKAEEL